MGVRFKRFRRRLQRTFRRQQRQVEELSEATEKGFERHFMRRLGRLKPVRRFVIGWIALMVLIVGCLVAQLTHLTAYYQRIVHVDGGIYNEGIVGSVSNVNPIYATSDVDKSLSRLLFAGLFTYNKNNQLVGELASGYEVGNNGKEYTVTLRTGLTWHDGKPLTSKDVVFTFNTIKNPDARSPLFASWQNVTVEAKGRNTVVFTLPSALAPFPYNLTTGILPQHILAKTDAVNLRSSNFNTMQPVGAGPFTWRGLQVNGNNPKDTEVQIALLPYERYVLGEPKIGEYIMHAYRSEDRLVDEFTSGQLTAAAGLEQVPQDLTDKTKVNSLVLNAGTYVFFKTTQGIMQNAKVRQALVKASDPDQVIASLDYTTREVVGPLLAGQLAFNKQYAQKTNDVPAAQATLAEDGWVTGPDGILVKEGQRLSFELLAIETDEYKQVADILRKQWRAIGVEMKTQFMPVSDYNNALASHSYNATLYGIAIGQDPDVYSYWESSQADIRSPGRLNLSEWNNTAADEALQAGRTRLDPALRTVKYEPLLKAWQEDAPALGLYQPRYIYLTRGTVNGLTDQAVLSGIGRFNGVQNWQIRTTKVVD